MFYIAGRPKNPVEESGAAPAVLDQYHCNHTEPVPLVPVAALPLAPREFGPGWGDSRSLISRDNNNEIYGIIALEKHAKKFWWH